MVDKSFHLVRFALALHLDLAPDAIAQEDRLAEDLGLDPLDLVLVVLRLEEVVQAEFPVADLEHATTVFDLVEIVRSWRTPADEEPALAPARRRDSGLRLARPALAC